MKVAAHIKLRNEPLFRYRMERGLSQAEACRELGLRYSDWSAIESMRFDLVGESTIKSVAEAIGVLPEELVPPMVKRKNMKSETFCFGTIPQERLVAIGKEALQLEAPQKDIDAELDIKHQVESALSKLTYREKMVVSLRYGLDGQGSFTLEEVGKIFKVTRERVRSIETSAIRKMRDQSCVEA